MKMRWVKVYKSEYVPVSSFHENTYKKVRKLEQKLQYYDADFGWVDVPVEVVDEDKLEAK